MHYSEIELPNPTKRVLDRVLKKKYFSTVLHRQNWCSSVRRITLNFTANQKYWISAKVVKHLIVGPGKLCASYWLHSKAEKNFLCDKE